LVPYVLYVTYAQVRAIGETLRSEAMRIFYVAAIAPSKVSEQCIGYTHM